MQIICKESTVKKKERQSNMYCRLKLNTHIFIGLLISLGGLLFLFRQLNKDSYLLSSIGETGNDYATMRILAAIKGRNTSSLVLPHKSTVILQPTQSCQNSGADLFTLFIVISSPENCHRRNAIRTVYEKQNWKHLMINKNESKMLFLMGISPDRNVQTELREEWLAYGDLILDDFQETYLNLTLKTLRMLKWAVEYCHRAKYIVKIDDDVHLNMARFFSYLRLFKGPAADNLIAGHKYDSVGPIWDPSSKWYTPPILWPKEKFPSFIGGFCYVMGHKAMAKIYKASLRVPFFHLEDVFLTGMVANLTLNMKTRNIDWIERSWTRYQHIFTLSCRFPLFVAIHSVTPSQIRCYGMLNINTFPCGFLRPLFTYC